MVLPVLLPGSAGLQREEQQEDHGAAEQLQTRTDRRPGEMMGAAAGVGSQQQLSWFIGR